MKFLFRTPLFDFDPDKESEIQQNWSKVLEAISVASPSLFKEIKGLNYTQLAYPIRLKVKKYILRGRYRSTPFGKFAAVGLGKTHLEKFWLDLQRTEELSATNISENPQGRSQEWHLSTGGFNQLDRKIFLTYQITEERWALVGIPSNVVINQLINHFKTSQSIRFSEFQSWFKEEYQNWVNEIWKHLIDVGILYSCEEWLKSKISPTIYSDIFIADEIGMGEKTSAAVREFFQTAGNLFTPMSSPYLARLKKWFQAKFDDRFVPLPFLISYPEFTSSDFFEMYPNGENQKDTIEIPSSSWGMEEVELYNIVNEAPLDPNIYHMDLAVKVLDDGRIILDNVICNRPFVFIGRFNRQPEVLELANEIKTKIYPYQDVIYAELRIFESHIVQGICATLPIFDNYISPFNQNDPKCIPLEEIEIGLRDSEFVLVHNRTEKRIIPIVTHPLNGKQISHPLMRLLWELDHQNGFKLAFYHPPQFISSTYSPRLTWGKTIIQPRKWLVHSSQFDSTDELRNWLKTNSLPCELLVGIYDRELLINWERKDGFEILWFELKKHPRCLLSEVLWKDKSPFASLRGKPIYPQLILSHRKAMEPIPGIGFYNSIHHESTDWVYVVLWVEEEDFDDTMVSLCSKDFVDFLKSNRIQWYYLVYPENEELQVRVRFLTRSTKQKSEILSFFFNYLSHQLRFEQRPYYPEVKKYGQKTYQISEELFWMESRLMAEINRRDSGLTSPSTIGIQSLVQFWIEMIFTVGLGSYGFEKIKAKVKRMTFELKRNLAGESNHLIPQRKLPLEWKREYRLKMISHLGHWAENQMKWQIISNHLHMQVNRFYSVNRKRMEDWLYYLLYKEMGKRIYRGKD